MKTTTLSLLALLSSLSFVAEANAEPLRVPAFTAYSEPDTGALRISRRQKTTRWTDPAQSVLWFGQIRQPGFLDATVVLTLPEGLKVDLTLDVAGQTLSAAAKGTGEPVEVKFGRVEIKEPGYRKFTLSAPKAKKDRFSVALDALVLDGSALENAHFNVTERRNAASVHLFYPAPRGEEITAFYTEVTGIEDPVHTYYMACGFDRGYFGMQVNSETERRIIFSVWDAAEGASADDRSTVAEENHTQLLKKGEGVHASVFGNEGTGGHSHLKYPWKTGEPQKFVVTAKVDGTFTDYTGWWFHPEKKEWTLLASFRAPKDGRYLRGLYSFSENFGGDTGHFQRKALFGNQWILLKNGEWRELTTATFSHDNAGKEVRLDRFMGLEDGQFFLAHGGFRPGFTEYGKAFTRPATGRKPEGVEALLKE